MSYWMITDRAFKNGTPTVDVGPQTCWVNNAAISPTNQRVQFATAKTFAVRLMTSPI